MTKLARVDRSTGRIDGVEQIREYELDSGIDRRRDLLKRELYEWIFEAWTAGLKSPKLLGDALDPPLSGSRITQILEDLGLHKRRMTIEDTAFPADLVNKLSLLNQRRKAARAR